MIHHKQIFNKRKMAAISPIFADGKLVSDFQIKSELILLPSVLQSKLQVHCQSLI